MSDTAPRFFPQIIPFHEVTDFSDDLDIKYQNDLNRYLYQLFSYGLNADGTRYADGVSGEGVTINNANVSMTVGRFFVADMRDGDAEMVIDAADGGVQSFAVSGSLRASGREMVLPPGVWRAFVDAGAARTHGAFGLTGTANAGTSFLSVSAALEALPRILDGDAVITVLSQRADARAEPIRVRGFSGRGTLVVEGPAVCSAVEVSDCACRVALTGVTIEASPEDGLSSALDARNAMVAFANGVIDARGSGKALCALARERGALWLSGVGFYGDAGCAAVAADALGRATLENGYGSGLGQAAVARRGGIVTGSGTLPPPHPWRPPFDLSVTQPVMPQAFYAAVDQLTQQGMSGGASAQAVASAAATALRAARDLTEAVVYTSLTQLEGGVRSAWRALSGDGVVAGEGAVSVVARAARTAAAVVTRARASRTGSFAGGLWEASDAVRQGRAVSDARIASLGVMAFPSIAAPTGKALLGMRLWLSRAALGGLPSPAALRLCAVSVDAALAGTPARGGDFGVIGSLSWGERLGFYLPVAAAAHVTAGGALGVFSETDATMVVCGASAGLASPEIEAVWG